MVSVPDPESVIERRDVTVHERTRSVPRERFEALRERYRRIDGVSMIGVTNDDGEVLLLNSNGWCPPGGDVELGEDWATAAARAVTKLAGGDVEIDGLELVERVLFRPDDDRLVTAIADAAATVEGR